MTNKSVTIIDIRIKGTNTISHDIIPKPVLQRKLRRIVNTNVTHIFKKAVLNMP